MVVGIALAGVPFSVHRQAGTVLAIGVQWVAAPNTTDAPASTQLSWDASSPEQQIQKGMTAEAFGQTIPQWTQKQSTQWAKSASPAASAIT